MCEDVARTVHISRQLGAAAPHRAGAHRRALRPLPERLRPANAATTRTAIDEPHHAADAPEVWFLTGSQAALRPRDPRPGRRTVAGHRRAAGRVAGAAGPRRVEAGAARRRRRSTASDARGQQRTRRASGVIAWMHTFSPAKMWIGGLDALQKPLLHLHTQAGMALPWSTIDMDFMNLNQAAHGDREFGYIQSRLGVARKTVAGHVDSPVVASRIAALGPRGARARTSCAACGWPGSATTCATSRSPRATRSRPQLRFGVSVNTYGVNDLVAVVDAGRRRRHRQAGRREYADTYRVAPELLPGGDRHESLRYGARIELGLRTFLAERRLRRLHHELRGPRRPAPAARPRRAAADGRRLRLRRRGRLEDRRCCCAA